MNKESVKKFGVFCLAGLAAVSIAACKGNGDNSKNIIISEDKTKRVINLFSPMEKTRPDADNVARTAADKTIILAEEKLGVSVQYNTYTAENYQDKTYDDVALDRVRSNMDDIYLLNPDTIQILGEENLLMDLSGLESAKNLRDVVKIANIIDGKLVAIPQEVVAYGLFINKDMFDQYNLSLPNTPEEFLECCRVSRKTELKRRLARTVGGLKRLYWLRHMQICTMEEIRKRRLPH